MPAQTQTAGTIISCGLKVTGGTYTSGSAYGMYTTGKFTAGIYVANAVTTTSALYGIQVEDVLTLTTTGVHKAIQGHTTYTPASSGYATSVGVVGKATLTASKTLTGGQAAMYGVQGQLAFGASSVINNSSTIFAALRGVIEGAPTCTAFSVVAGLYVDNLSTGILTGGEYGSSLAALTNHGLGIDHAIMIYAANAGNTITNLLSIQGDSQSIVSSGAVGTTGAAKLKVLWGTTTYYINMYQS